MTFTVRRVEADEWERVRDLRLRSLQDPVAALAFLDTFENASVQPDEFWQQRTANAAPVGRTRSTSRSRRAASGSDPRR